jgi:hypothetical protein
MLAMSLQDEEKNGPQETNGNATPYAMADNVLHYRFLVYLFGVFFIESLTPSEDNRKV